MASLNLVPPAVLEGMTGGPRHAGERVHLLFVFLQIEIHRRQMLCRVELGNWWERQHSKVSTTRCRLWYTWLFRTFAWFNATRVRVMAPGQSTIVRWCKTQSKYRQSPCHPTVAMTVRAWSYMYTHRLFTWCICTVSLIGLFSWAGSNVKTKRSCHTIAI